MIQKYLHLRGKVYYFRWRVPIDLHLLFGVTEVTLSLRTSDYMRAIVWLGQLVQVIGGIRRVRYAYLSLELPLRQDSCRIFFRYFGVSPQFCLKTLHVRK